MSAPAQRAPPYGGRAAAGPVVGGVADTISNCYSRQNSDRRIDEHKLTKEMTLDMFRNSALHRTFARQTLTAVTRATKDPHAYSMATTLLSLDPLTGTYSVADLREFQGWYNQHHALEAVTFLELEDKTKHSREMALIKKQILNEKHAA
jgi:hypothetical protein